MAISTYAELQTAVQNWLNRTDADMVARAVELIALAEAKLKVDEDIWTVTKTTLALATAEVALPSAYREMKYLYLDSDTARGELELRTAPELAEVRSRNATGIPRYFAVHKNEDASTKTLLLAPTPDGSYTAQFWYKAGIAVLSDTNTTNWLLTNYPNLYLYAALLESAPYLRDDERILLWQGMYDDGVNRLRKYRTREEFAGKKVPRAKVLG